MECRRCGEGHYDPETGIADCCGVSQRRLVSRAMGRRHRKIGGKRGRNSGKVSQHGKKK